MIVHPLTIVMLSTRNNVTYIAALYRIVSILVHQAVGSIQMTFVITDRGRGLVVHHQAYALAMSIVVKSFEIEVWIGCLEVEDIVLGVSEPVFPTNVPALNEDLRETMLGGKVDIALHVDGVGRVVARRLYLAVVGLTNLDGRQVIGI